VTVSEVMITRVPHGVLRSRIDSAFYAPEHLERERHLRQLGVARPAIGQMASLVTDGTHKTPTYIESGVPFLSATNIDGGALHFEDHKFVRVSSTSRVELRAAAE
jgi:type I restriction enzyme S subunit